jgi:hypothetical protein
VKLRTGLDIKKKEKEREQKKKTRSSVQSKNNITVSVMNPSFTRQ